VRQREVAEQIGAGLSTSYLILLKIESALSNVLGSKIFPYL